MLLQFSSKDTKIIMYIYSWFHFVSALSWYRYWHGDNLPPSFSPMKSIAKCCWMLPPKYFWNHDMLCAYLDNRTVEVKLLLTEARPQRPCSLCLFSGMLSPEPWATCQGQATGRALPDSPSWAHLLSHLSQVPTHVHKEASVDSRAQPEASQIKH